MLHTSFHPSRSHDSSRQKRKRSSMPKHPSANTRQHTSAPMLGAGKGLQKCWQLDDWMRASIRWFMTCTPILIWKSFPGHHFDCIFVFPQNPPPVWSHHQFLGSSSVWTNPTSIAALLRRGELSMSDLLRVRLFQVTHACGWF